MKEYDYIVNPRGHKWRETEEHDIAMFVVEAQFCNGPMCLKCGYSFCQHCNKGAAKEDCKVP